MLCPLPSSAVSPPKQLLVLSASLIILFFMPSLLLRTGAACSLLHYPPKGKHFPWSGELTATWKHFEKLVHL